MHRHLHHIADPEWIQKGRDGQWFLNCYSFSLTAN